MEQACLRTENAKAVIALESRGFIQDFLLEQGHIRWIQSGEIIGPEGFEVIEVILCREPQRPGKLSLIYGIALQDPPVKGILLTHLKTYSRGMSVPLWLKLSKSFSALL